MDMPAHTAQATREDCVEHTVVIHDGLGLHARPAARLAQTAQQFQCAVTLSLDNATVDAKSILDILSLAAPCGSELFLRCQGADAEIASAALVALLSQPLAVEER